MAFALAKRQSGLNEETAFMCGLLHEIGKLYVLTKAAKYPSFLRDEESLARVLELWCAPIGTSIVEVWQFSEEVCQSMSPQDHVSDRHGTLASMADVVLVSRLLVDRSDDETFAWEADLSCVRLGVDEVSVPEIHSLYEQKMRTIRQSLS
jgi:HD-like signal output (HDOD) protein